MFRTNSGGTVAISGDRAFDIQRGDKNAGQGEGPKVLKLTFLFLVRTLLAVLPSPAEPREVNVYRLRNFGNVMRGYRQMVWAWMFRTGHSWGTLSATVTRGDGTVVDYGIVSLRVVTTAGVNKIVAFLNAGDTTTGQNFKYHGFGIGTTAEASGDTALVTEFTTEYATNSTRPTGSQTTGGSSNIYRTVATFTPDSGGVLAVTEHGVFSATSAGTLLDRSKFAAMNLDSANGDNLQATYDLTVPAGG